jgi:hypothetical protein
VDELPSWLEPLLDAETMRATDRWAIEERGVPGIELMERAGAGVTRARAARAGRGGGDRVRQGQQRRRRSLVAKRLLRETGREVTSCLAPPEELTGDARGTSSDFGPAPLAPDGVPWSEREEPGARAAAGGNCSQARRSSWTHCSAQVGVCQRRGGAGHRR